MRARGTLVVVPEAPEDPASVGAAELTDATDVPVGSPVVARPPRGGLPRWPRVWWVVGPLLAVSLVALLLGTFWPAPYGMLSPGSADPVGPLLQIDNPKVYRHPGEIRFVTVSVNGPGAAPSYLQALWGWVDPDSDVFPSNVVSEGRSGAEDRRYQSILMADSQHAAAYLALHRLGFAVNQVASGVLVTDVEKGSPADGHLTAGDTITAVDGSPINSSNDLSALLGQLEPGRRVDLTIQRLPDLTLHQAVTLGSRVDQTGHTRAYLGIFLATRIRYQLPFSVQVDTNRVGGPSAGLAFTLAVMDRLSPKGITKGHNVAVTGTISPDGTVGDVGGVAQKTVAVRESGADVFLVPVDEVAEAKKKAGKHLKVIGVKTLDEALAALAKLPQT